MDYGTDAGCRVDGTRGGSDVGKEASDVRIRIKHGKFSGTIVIGR